MPSLLDKLRLKTTVDCDTLDAEVAASLGPFVDCTSNQAIAYFEIQRDRHQDLLRHAATTAREVHPAMNELSSVSLEALAVEIVMVKLLLLLVPHLTGNVHVQINPFDSYSTERMVNGAQRIVGIFQHVDTTFDTLRICIKIPSTWEGLQACKQLEEMGIKTLATTLFCLEQAALAGSSGCTFIAPYVNELRVHIDDG